MLTMAEGKTELNLFPIETPKSENIQETLKPTIICMKIFGLYYDNLNNPALNTIVPVTERRTYQQNKSSESSSVTLELSTHSAETILEIPVTNRKERIKCLVQKCYCALGLLFLSLNVIRFGLSVVFDDSLQLSFRISNLMFYLQTTSAAVCIIFSCWAPGHFRKLYKEWSEFYSDPVTRSLGLVPTCCKRVIRIITCGFLVGLVANNVLLLTTLFYEKIPLQQALLENLCAPFPVTGWTIALAVVVQVTNSAAWLLPLSFVLCLAFVMLVHYNRLSLVIRTHIRQSEGKIPAKLKELRKCHLKMCQLLQVLNQFLRSYLATLYLTNLVSCCFTLYQLVNSEDNMMAFFNNIMWLISNVASVAVVSVGLAFVHEAAHAPLEDLFAIDTGAADVSDSIQLQLFLSKLTGTSIGATVFSLLVVTKEFLITIVGAFITYFFLLIQFKI